MRKLALLVCCGLTLMILSQTSVFAAWSANGVPLCSGKNVYMDASVASDGSGGAIAAWLDAPSFPIGGIYVQRVMADGTVLWGTNGVPLWQDPTGSAYTYPPRVIADGQGGAIIAWSDARTGNMEVYCQRVDNTGTPLWPVGGVNVSQWPGTQYYCNLAPDGTGGAIVLWNDTSGTRNGHLFARRINSAGIPSWTAGGVQVSRAPLFGGNELGCELIADGGGGVIVVWSALQSPVTTGLNIYAQRVDTLGNLSWNTAGVPISMGEDNQENPKVVSDGKGGAIMTWEDSRTGYSIDIYAQRADLSGNVRWQINGVPICTSGGDNRSPDLTADGQGGAIIAWGGFRTGQVDLLAQRVDSLGNMLWQPDGETVCGATGFQAEPRLAPDNIGGAVIVWQDGRDGNLNIYGQRMGPDGNPVWTEAGVSICTAVNDQHGVRVVPDGSGGAVAIWRDDRGGNCDVYAYWPSGIADVPANPATSIALNQNVPNPFNPTTEITFSVATPGRIKLSIQDVSGHVLRTLVDAWREPSTYTEIWDGRAGDGTELPSGIYLCRLEARDLVATRKMALLK